MQNDISGTNSAFQVANVHPFPIHIEIIADRICELPDTGGNSSDPAV
jgi:hypothetical protein